MLLRSKNDVQFLIKNYKVKLCILLLTRTKENVFSILKSISISIYSLLDYYRLKNLSSVFDHDIHNELVTLRKIFSSYTPRSHSSTLRVSRFTHIK